MATINTTPNSLDEAMTMIAALTRWLNKATDLLGDNATAWEGEEDSVQEEHQDLIDANDKFFRSWNSRDGALVKALTTMEGKRPKSVQTIYHYNGHYWAFADEKMGGRKISFGEEQVHQMVGENSARVINL